MSIVWRVSIGVLLIGVVAWLALPRIDSYVKAQVIPPSKRKPTPPPTSHPTGPSIARSGSLPALHSGTFETVTLDAGGNELSRRRLRAEYFVENLGNGVTLEMVRIPAGEFQMGSSESEVQEALSDAKRYDGSVSLDWFKNEMPKHSVRVAEFYIGRFEVTRAQWRQVARLPKVNIDDIEEISSLSFLSKDSWRQPVEVGIWNYVVEFCARLQKKTGKTYRLPTEAEWEYAARAGATTPFAFGLTITPQIENYNGEHPFGAAPKGVFREKSIEVGSLKVANAFGLYDMHGNLHEWCQDVWHDSYVGAPIDGSAWITGGEQDYRVFRGGDSFDGGYACRVASRHRAQVGDRISMAGVGLRVVLAVRTK